MSAARLSSSRCSTPDALEAAAPLPTLGSRARGLNGGAADGMATPVTPPERIRRSDDTSGAAPAVGAARRGAAESSSVNEVIVPPPRVGGAPRLSSRRSMRCSSLAPGRCPTGLTRDADDCGSPCLYTASCAEELEQLSRSLTGLPEMLRTLSARTCMQRATTSSKARWHWSGGIARSSASPAAAAGARPDGGGASRASV